MTTIAVTGVAGYLGRKLCEAVDTDDATSRVVGVDVAEPAWATSKLEFYRTDVRSPELAEVIAGCDALVHLASVASDTREAESVSLDGTRNALAAAAGAGIRRIVVASSHSVYGHHPDNDVPLTESSAIRPAPGFGAAQAAAEDVVSVFRADHPEIAVSVLRLSWVCGPTISGKYARVLEAPVRFVVDGHEPPVQAIHEDDAVGAILFALDRELSGTYNTSASDWLDRAGDVLRQPQLTLGRDQAQRWSELATRFGLSWLFPSDLARMMHPNVMSNARLREAGFEPAHTTAEALRAAIDAGHGWISLGRFRFRLRWLAVAAATAAALLISSAARGTDGSATRESD